MSTNTKFSVYVGSLDERVSDRVLYDILIQAGRVVDLHIPRDKETDRPKGYAFAEYETEEIAEYAVRLFSGLVTLYNRTLKFAISGQDKPSPNVASTVMPTPNFSNKLRSPPVPINNVENLQNSMSLSAPCKIPAYAETYPSVPIPPGVNNQSNGLHLNGNNFEYSRRVIGATLDTISRPRSRRYDMSNPISYPSY
ncbi:putative nucleotide-binding alpha-beta plait domain-containing protein [Rosa chinensis]|uniref:Putative nucleotide-binding alpha-beta plait domain-containing protein n=1 Tax=Rosa chinensis TaxID=74649 RepID=A0A2P6PKP6_ROSCH|nr:cleavage stimulation factor subunit 2 tau variant isoform X1 [Rosa chinensis]PRQ22504.1 putative nucleotide-binding alpha-beta plait domain-containing protein [Rosa chinensis]